MRSLVQRFPGQIKAVADGIDFLKVCATGDKFFANRQCAESRLHRAGEREPVTGERFCAANTRARAGGGKNRVQRECLGAITGPSRPPRASGAPAFESASTAGTEPVCNLLSDKLDWGFWAARARAGGGGAGDGAGVGLLTDAAVFTGGWRGRPDYAMHGRMSCAGM